MDDKNSKSLQLAKQFVATKAFITYRGKTLILREAGSYTDGSNEGRYDVPGGRMNPGERYREALTREIKEETGLTVTIGNPIAVGQWDPVVKNEQWHIVGIYFLCKARGSKVSLSPDHDDYQWITPKDYKKYPLIENLNHVFKEYSAQLWPSHTKTLKT